MRILLFIASAAAFSLMAAAPAAAAPFERIAKRVSYAEYNLDNEAGAAATLRRIERAAAVVCSARDGPMPLVERARIRTCVRAETEDAVAAVGHAGLTALYFNRRPSVIIAAR